MIFRKVGVQNNVLQAAERDMVYSGNARRVYPRLERILAAQGR